MKSTSFQLISPVDGQVFAQRDYATSGRIEAVLASSAQAFSSWQKTDLSTRTEICRKVVHYFVENANEIGLEITMQMGRPIRFSPSELKGGFKERANYMIDAAGDALADNLIDEKSGFKRFISHEPIGTVLVLAPWNYPYLTSVNVIIPAIMAGNTVILKHSEQTALCAERYQEAFNTAGLPEGVFQYLHADHEQIAKVIQDERIHYVAFTGSVDGGKAVQKAIGSRFITAGLELGGKDPAYVADDVDLDFAIENLVDGAFFNSGQSCCGIERIYVHENHFEAFVDGFVKLTKTYVVGDPRDPLTTLGPMVRTQNARNVLNHIESATRAGAKKLISTADFPNLSLPYLAPQVLINVHHDMEVMREETFGPVVGIMSVKNDEEAIKLMNDSLYGLTASIWTKDVERAMRIGKKVETGTFFMNRCDYLDPALAWTGVKNSGKGCTLSALGYEHLTRPKSYHFRSL